MRLSLLKFTTSIFCVAGFMTAAHADYTSSANNNPPPAPPAVVSSSYNTSEAPPSTTVSSHHGLHHRDNSIYSSATPVYSKHHRSQPFWIAMHRGEPIPTNAVVVGNQYQPNARFYVCRAKYHGGVHPGKFFAGNCNISWHGREMMMRDYEILVSAT